MAPKQKSEEKKPKVPATERYDYSRTEGPRSDDPRCTGPPCFGEHLVAAPGRGSPSGSNASATWTACKECGLRLSYTPAYGAHGLTRQAGPLQKDVADQLKKNPVKGSVDLTNRKIGYDAQERSLEAKLEKVKQEKAAWAESQRLKNKAMGNQTTSKTSAGGEENPGRGRQGQSSTLLDPSSQGSEPKKTEGVINLEEDMNKTPGRKSRRADEAAEELEYSQRGNQDEKDWSVVSTPPGSSPS